MDDTHPDSDAAEAADLAAEFAADAQPPSRDAAPLVDLDAVPEGHQSGYVALIGPPNVGKSTLMNQLVGTKLSIVTPKPSTTRHRVLGILTRPGSQIVFLDTPGVVKPQYRLHDLMMQDVTRAVHDADVLLFMHDATKEQVHTHALDRLVDRPALLVLNKMDRIDHAQALPLVEQYTAARAFDAIVPISAKTGFNLDALLDEITQRLPQGPPFYPADQLSEHPEKFFVAEIVREAIFNQFRQEIPYSTQVNVVSFQERPGEKDFIDCEIVVERDTQKGILIGKGGSALKRIGAAAREQIEAFTGRPVYLQLHVKARADWRNREGMLKSYGYGG